MKDDLGKRMKSQYEVRTRNFLPRRTYAIIRLDGKAFHSFTTGMQRPYDLSLMDMMDQTAMHLMKEIQGSKLAYVQSDEISILLTDFSTINTDAWFDYNIQKMTSISASLATSKFNQILLANKIRRQREDLLMTTCNESDILTTKMANFDSRVFSIPDPIEVENYFIWRQKDAIRNSISMTAQSLYSHKDSHKELHKKSQSDMQELAFQKGVNWNDMPGGFKNGRTIAKFTKHNNFTIQTPDFLKNRELLINLIPKYN